MSEPAIVIKSVRKAFSESGEEPLWALRGVSLSIFPGELTVLMGPSGSGKTTLLSVAGALLRPTQGQISACGIQLERLNERALQLFRRQSIGFIFQSYNLLSSLTARENIQVALSLRGADDSQADRLLQEVGMEDKAGSYPMQLSGGQRQRIAIARALAGSPPIVLADEPTAALDAYQGRRVMKLLRQAALNERTTVVVVTHDPRVREFADRVIEMEDGRIKQIIRRVRTVPALRSGISSVHLMATMAN